MKKFLFILFGAFVALGAIAAGETVPTTKSYVDSVVAQKQDKISANIIVPAGYTRLEYLESTGTQYIDTGVVADATTEAEVDFMDFVGSSALFFTTNGGWYVRNFGIIINDYLRFSMNCDGRTTYTRPSGTNVSGNIKLLTTGIFLNDTQLSIGMGQIPSSTAFTTTYPIVLFGSNMAGTPSASAKVKIRYFKLWKNHELVRNFIPARRDSDDEMGMYDTVTNTFFTNSGTGEFVAGPVIGYQNQVLTNTGTAGEYGAKGIYDANGAYATQTQNLVDAATMNTAVQNAIDSEFQCIEWLDPSDHTSDCLLLQLGGPAGYTQLQYIESTGTQWIEVQYFANPNTKVYADFQLTNPSRRDKFIFFGGWRPLCLAAMFGYNGQFAYCAWDDGTTNNLVYSNQSADLNRHRFIISAQNKLESWPMIDFRLKTHTGKTVADLNASASATERFLLFGHNIEDKRVSMKLYSFKIWDNDSLVRNFIPARRNSDGVLGMYDTVTNTFFTNSGTGEFVAGPVGGTDEFIAGSAVYLPQGD